MSALRNALRPALTPALGSARRGVSRYFTPSNSVAQSYVELGSPLMLSMSSWEIEFSIYGNSIATSNEQIVLGKTDDDRGFIRFKLGVLEINLTNTGGQTVFTDILVENDRLTTFSVKFDVSTGDATATNISKGIEQTLVTVSENANFNSVAHKSTKFTDNIIANLKVWANGDRDSGLLILDMPINRHYTPQNNTVLDESGNGNNGTFVNIAAGRSKYYQQRADGNFVDLQGNVLEVAY